MYFAQSLHSVSFIYSIEFYRRFAFSNRNTDLLAKTSDSLKFKYMIKN